MEKTKFVQCRGIFRWGGGVADDLPGTVEFQKPLARETRETHEKGRFSFAFFRVFRG
jgi:hypothetical protein